MRTLGLLLTLAFAVHAADAVDPQEAQEALKEFEKAFKATKEIEERQNAVYDLHDVPHDLVIKRLQILLKHKDPRVRNVAALALGGQLHNVALAGTVLMQSYVKDYKNTEVLSSVLEGMAELKYLGYWPKAKPALKDERNAVIIRVLELLGTNEDWRAIPRLLELYRVAMPKKVSWKTGEVKVDTGAAGDADQKAAEAEFNRKYGRGGSKAKAKAKAKARGFDLRNFSTQIRKCVKKITDQDFDTSWDFEDWYVENYLMVARKIAEMDGSDVEAAVAKAKRELPKLKADVESARKKLEEELAKDAKNR
ncbi:MAG: HEAT repeat domain-containing protein [Planctomycetota bacterium]|jgi:hypothetical protein